MGPAPTPPPTPLRSMASSPVTLPSPHGAGPNSTTYAAALHGFFACNPSLSAPELACYVADASKTSTW
ncbi:hypothetical protein OPV22_011470 [Ensete ventricosum]|uniref:Uncharacterized protein n=1 Tax=Ensete ventricosum TaxID=4639 RepID=A0AAV8R9S1_ENSVE|nr:hypothetical protein OPV22_011470 [Ensete ventricosum]